MLDEQISYEAPFPRHKSWQARKIVRPLHYISLPTQGVCVRHTVTRWVESPDPIPPEHVRLVRHDPKP